MRVQQGSILGQFLSLIHNIDLPYLEEKKHEIVLFADNTSVKLKLLKQESNYADVKNALSEVVHWCSEKVTSQ